MPAGAEDFQREADALEAWVAERRVSAPPDRIWSIDREDGKVALRLDGGDGFSTYVAVWFLSATLALVPGEGQVVLSVSRWSSTDPVANWPTPSQDQVFTDAATAFAALKALF